MNRGQGKPQTGSQNKKRIRRPSKGSPKLGAKKLQIIRERYDEEEDDQWK